MKELGDHPPENEKELFNLRHLFLRETPLKEGLKFWRDVSVCWMHNHFWPFQIKLDVVLASRVIHNHIMGVDPNDSIMKEVIRDVKSRN